MNKDADETSWLKQLVAAGHQELGGRMGGHSHRLHLPWVAAQEDGEPFPCLPSSRGLLQAPHSISSPFEETCFPVEWTDWTPSVTSS